VKEYLIRAFLIDFDMLASDLESCVHGAWDGDANSSRRLLRIKERRDDIEGELLILQRAGLDPLSELSSFDERVVECMGMILNVEELSSPQLDRAKESCFADDCWWLT
jgi:hypothetical protein